MDKGANITTDTLESVTTRLTHGMSCLDHNEGLCIYRMIDQGIELVTSWPVVKQISTNEGILV